MIFGRKKRAAVDDAADEVVEVEDEKTKDTDASEDEPTSDSAQARAWDEAFDREEGPFDIDEVDLDADDVQRLDFGALVVTPFEGMTLQLQAEREQRRIQAVVVSDGESALEVAVFAAPIKSSIAEEVREDIKTATKRQQGKLQVVEGPFGTEVRRAIPVKDPEGKPALHVSRTWLVSGPGWLLRGVLLGKAALDPDDENAQVALFEFFSNLVVRRGNTPAAPGKLLYLQLPEKEE